jgi:DNA-binding MarR family transcriptional regulator
MDRATSAADRRPIGFWLKLVDRLIDDSFDALLGQAGLTRRLWQVLSALWGGPATVEQLDTGLAPFLDVAQPTVDPVVEDLSARGWTTRTGDGRVTITEAGVAAHADLLARVSENRRRLTAGIAAEEYAATIGVLRRMAANLGWADPTDELPG